ncbi:rhodanese-like domain-containing protein 4A, chloroplastic [Magnolia sinica]|uniref:rhodanese-like domain-containing protein 4A, chloroplastic n=1 Tax=Magnolia sinica TaxID=86752 RepID=UPI00265A341E|nr:rhodanese-like domain-containing protein 4A, chloroplastic [Magnolia sinica]
MELLTVSISSLSPSLQNHQHISKTASLSLDTSQNCLSIPKTTCHFSSYRQNHLSLHRTTHILISLENRIPSRQNHLSILKTTSFHKKPNTHLSNSLQSHLSELKTASSHKISTTHLSNPLQNCLSDIEIAYFIKIPIDHSSNLLQNHLSTFKPISFYKILTTHFPNCLRNHLSFFKTAMSLSLLAVSTPFPSLAAESAIPTEQLSDKINIESILISIDDFFNRNPFFVASVTFVWLVVIPLTQEYLKKFKYISTIGAFLKLRDDPNTLLLDIRNKQSLASLGSPNLKILKKSAVQIEFSEGDEDGFVKEVLRNFIDPRNTIVCVLDNFDGNSLKVAELLFKNGFKEAYAIKGGLRGKDGWQDIQENLLPPSVHVYSRKKGKRSQQLDVSKEKTDRRNGENGKIPTSKNIHQDADRKVENGSVKPAETAPQGNLSLGRPLSPYPNYPDLKPPSSPTPSKPRN